MTVQQSNKTREFIQFWLESQKRELNLTSGQFAELIGARPNITSRYLSGALPVPFEVVLTVAYESDCTQEDIQRLFDAYADIRLGTYKKSNFRWMKLRPTATLVVDGEKQCFSCGRTLSTSKFRVEARAPLKYAASCRYCESANTRTRVTARRKQKKAAVTAPAKKRKFPEFRGYDLAL